MEQQRITFQSATFGQLSALISGNNAAPVLVLLHGYPESATLWRNVIPELSKSFFVVAPDLLGAGDSDLPSESLTIEQLAEGVKATLEELNIERKIVLAGHSMGGYTALAFAEKYNDSLAGLSLVHSSAAADNDDKKKTREQAIRIMEGGGKAQFLREMTPKLFSKTTLQHNPEIVPEQIQRALELPVESMIGYYRAMIARPERTEVLKQAAFPVQMILGKDDEIVPLKSGLTQGSLAPVASIEVIEDCGHMSMLEQPAQLAAHLQRFSNYCYNTRFQEMLV